MIEDARVNALSAQGAPLDLTQAYVRKGLAKIILDDIDAYACVTYHDGHRRHLGASVIGDDCSRKVYYGFRWMTDEKPNGRMQRLFQRGHLEEQRFIEYLRGIGFEVWDVHPETGKQFRCAGVNGHFGGSLDSILRPPSRLNLPDGILFLGEYKTKGTGSGFVKLQQDGIMLSNGQHYDQMCVYGAKYGYGYACYFSVNKNDDALHVEVVELSAKRAAEVEAKAAYIISLDKPPPRISMSETHYKCKNCTFVGVCHRGEVPARNCRSCVYSSPVQDAQWRCNGYNAILSEDVIKVGCEQWTHIR